MQAELALIGTYYFVFGIGTLLAYFIK